MAKLRALQELHTPKRPVSANGVISNGHGITSNGHDTKLSRSSKLRSLSDRLNEQASLEQHVSDRTRKILENMRRERSLSSTSQALNASSQHNLNSSSRRSSLSRQTSFLIEGNPEQKGSDDQSDLSSPARDSTHTSISNLVRECELPTVKKYLKQSGETERRTFNRTDSKCSKRPKKRRPSSLAQLDTIPGSGEDSSGLARCFINNHSKLVSPESGFEESNYLEGPVTVNSLGGDNFNRSISVDLPMGKNHPLLSSFSEKPGEDEEDILSDSSSGSSSMS